MSEGSAAFSFECDAPSYAVVRACQRCGLEAPEDVRWCRVSHFRETANHRRDVLNPLTWGELLGLVQPREGRCHCGRELPRLERYTFTFASGRQQHYYLGQCRACRTIFWEESSATSPPPPY